MFHFINNAMKKLLKTIKTAAIASVAAVSFVAVSIPAQAADWTVNQTANVTRDNLRLDQGDTDSVTDSVQAFNTARLNKHSDSINAGSTQDVDFTTSTLDLLQSQDTVTSEQAVNFIEADDISGTNGSKVLQNVIITIPTALLDQDLANGNVGGNTQALNITKANGEISHLRQTVSQTGTMTLDQDSVSSPRNSQALNYVSGNGNISGTSQTTTLNGVTSLKQASIGGYNTQGVNYMFDGTNTSATQLATLTGGASMDQSAAGGNNTQDVNYIESSSFGTVQQTTSSTGLLAMQNMSSGDSNRQVINSAKASTTSYGSGNSSSLTQEFTATSVASFQQLANSNDNLQAINLAESQQNVATLSQTVTVSDTNEFLLKQANGGTSLQAANIATLTGSESNNVTQTINSAPRTGLTQTAAQSGNKQALNLIQLGTSSSQSATGHQQTFTAGNGATSLLQQGTGTNNKQAFNRIEKTSGRVTAHVTQTTDLSRSASFDMDQLMTNGGNDGTQAANHIKINSSNLTNVAQTFTASRNGNDITQNSPAGNLIQAVNLIDLGNSGISDNIGPHQTFNANGGDVDMEQLGAGENNLQALNATVGANNSTAVMISQTYTVAGSEDTMKQNGVSTSGQFGNFVGTRF